MHGYRDHCIRKAYPSISLYCPYYIYQLLCPYCGYRQKVEEYPAHHHKRPQNPPPNYIPNVPTLVISIESSAMSPCVHKYTYLWLKNGESFWAYIVYVGKRAVSGWKYKGGRWVQFNLHLKQIKNFTCP
jgi:hypothetical protein